MRSSYLLAALGLAWGAFVGLPTVGLAAPTTTSPPVTQLAKLPETPPASAPIAPAKAVPGPKAEGKQLAQLAYPVPNTASAAELLRAASDYAFYADWAHYREYLNLIISAYPGTDEAGYAGVLLADDFAREGDATAAAALSGEIAEAEPSAEVQAFSALTVTAGAAHRAKDVAPEEQAYLAYLQTWKGTASADMVALRLGDLYRFSMSDYDKAIALYQHLLTEHPSGPLAEEALVAIAETLNWSETNRNEEAAVYYEKVLSIAQDPGIQVRALYGYGEMQIASGELPAAADTFSQIIAAYPNHPSAALAYAMRSGVADKQGDWTRTVSDAKAFLSYPSSSRFHTARAHWVLAKDAFRDGRLEEAEAEFTRLAELAETTYHNVQFKGEAQVGLAFCQSARGDLRGALQSFLAAAAVEYSPDLKCWHLYRAARIAQRLRDDVTASQIARRMASEFPGHHLTTKLLGRELLAAPDF